MNAVPDPTADAPEDWFTSRVRPFAVLHVGSPGMSGRWTTRDEVTAGNQLDAVLSHLELRRGADDRTALTCLTGWIGGPVARALAVGVVRDGVVIRLAGPDPVRLYQLSEGYVTALAITPLSIAVGPAHPWAAYPGTAPPGVEVIAEQGGLQRLAVAELTRWASPLIDAFHTRSRLSRTALWGQLADSIGVLPRLLCDADTAVPAATWIERIADFLAAPGVPWRHRPTVWQADSAGEPVVVAHRGSCCLLFRACPPGGVDAAGPPYCGTCSLRSREDVERRVVSVAECRPAAVEPTG